jgi:hypothetical protein
VRVDAVAGVSAGLPRLAFRPLPGRTVEAASPLDPGLAELLDQLDRGWLGIAGERVDELVGVADDHDLGVFGSGGDQFGQRPDQLGVQACLRLVEHEERGSDSVRTLHTRSVLDAEQGPTQELVVAAQRLLATAWQYPVRLRIHDVIRTWGRHTVLRYRVKDGPGDAAAFVIVKAVNRAGQVVTDERAGLELLAELPAVRDLVPHLYAADAEDTLLVMADLGNGPWLGQLLQAKAGWAQDGLLESMSGLAGVHSSTRGRHARYVQLRGRARTVPAVAKHAGRRRFVPGLGAGRGEPDRGGCGWPCAARRVWGGGGWARVAGGPGRGPARRGGATWWSP